MALSPVQIQVLKSRLARKFWESIKTDGLEPEDFPMAILNLQKLGTDSRKELQQLCDALTTLMLKIKEYSPSELGDIISSKDGNTYYDGFGIVEEQVNHWWQLTLKQERVIDTKIGKNELYSFVIELPVNSNLDGVSILRLHALITVLQEIPSIIKYDAA